MLFQPALLPNVQLDLDSVAELSDLPPLWALHDLFPCHRLSLVAAPTGSGLTQLACHLASAFATQPGISTGRTMYPPANPDGSLPDPIIIPNETGPQSCPTVLLISYRDQHDVLKPRLQALGIDPDQVLILSKVHREYPKVYGQEPRGRSAPFSLDDLDALSEVLHEHKTIRMVLIDNADLLIAATNDPARAKVQRDLDALANVAQHREVAIVLLAGVPHLQRNPFASRLFAAMRDACRLVYFMAPDLEDPEQRLLFCAKNTLARFNSTRKLQTLTPASLSSFRALNTNLQSLTLPHYFALLHQQQSSSHRSGPSPDMHDDACQFLLQALAIGPRPAGARRNPAPGTLRYMADEAGCAWGTILRAKSTLHITSRFEQEQKHWTWHLPATIPQLAQSPIPVSPSSSSTKNQVPSLEATTCAPPPSTEAQPPIPPQDTPPHPTPARTCAPVPETVAQSSPTAVPAPVPGCREDGPSATPTPEPCPSPDSSSAPSSLNRHSDLVIRVSQPLQSTQSVTAPEAAAPPDLLGPSSPATEQSMITT